MRMPEGIAVMFAFCPTGKGGGVDPHCAANTAGGTVFHGTTDKNLVKILKTGLIPAASRGNSASAKTKAASKGKVYTTKSFDNAVQFAQAIAQKTNKEAVVLEIKVPKGQKLFPDAFSFSSKDFFKVGAIPREWIKGYHEVPFASPTTKRESPKIKV